MCKNTYRYFGVYIIKRHLKRNDGNNILPIKKKRMLHQLMVTLYLCIYIFLTLTMFRINECRLHTILVDNL